MHMDDQKIRNSQNKKTNFVMWIFLAFIVYFLITEHWAHIVPYLPWLILLACPLLHIFMHGGHGHGSHDKHSHHGEE
ncbi:MAG: DUF2933 domain-containing protein [Gammaproteobacteria bacterium]|nr:DUF2933 domain-containing protein [Gammaproteobacteria bacterium]NIN62122.1 DUF2933 domain-containing protein [Gammaproteobacteria bacterium]NIO63616.1 DUF2933 domain-containing protein [Gammaproteobacteria bacterium]NIP48998.1 DUF2933 domain-containing protein [Gammaproteobacteria bacterium]NIQ09454.1 DUF2933 domain-containing protein [Gammaproteobacteria bacterium]